MTVQFGAFTFDSRSGQLRRNDQAIPLPGAASEVLVALLENRPDMVRKETLLERVWRGTAVSEASLSVAIAKLREALSDDPQQPRFIRTFHRKGYAFIAEATELTEHGGHAAGVSVFVLEWNGQRLVLNEGENVVATLRGVVEKTQTRPLEVLVVHDFDEDTTVPVVKRMQAEMPELRLHRNTLGRGALNAMKSGLRAAISAIKASTDHIPASDAPSRSR